MAKKNKFSRKQVIEFLERDIEVAKSLRKDVTKPDVWDHYWDHYVMGEQYALKLLKEGI